MSEHIAKDLALVLAALPEDDPERHAALVHAECCSSCCSLLERAASILERLDNEELTVDPRLKTRIMASIDALERERSKPRWEVHALALGSLISIAVALQDKGTRTGWFPAHAHWCLMWQLLGAGISFAGTAFLARLWALRTSPTQFGLAAMGGALVGQLCLRMLCPAHDVLQHLLAFHVTGVLICTLLGYALARSRLQGA